MCSLPYRWQHRRHGKLNTSHSSNCCFYEIRVINCIFKVITAGTSLCFLQFSTLYPEMVDGIIVLDVFGFVPTDPVLQHYFSSLLEKNNNNLIVGKMQNYFIKLSLWATLVCVSDFLTSHFIAERNTPNHEAGDGGDAQVWKKGRREEEGLHVREGGGEVSLYFIANSSGVSFLFMCLCRSEVKLCCFLHATELLAITVGNVGIRFWQSELHFVVSLFS